MQRLNSEIKILAAPRDVWRVIADLNSYSEWNSQLSFLGVTSAGNSRIKVKLKPLYYRTIKSTLLVKNVKKGSSYLFSDIRVLPLGALKVECLFTLSKNDDGSTTLHLHQQYTGWLSRFMKQSGRLLEAKKICIKMNAEIKRRAEDLYHLEQAEVASLSA